MDNPPAGLSALENGNGSNDSHKLEQPVAKAKQHSYNPHVVEALHELVNEFQDKLLVKGKNLESGTIGDGESSDASIKNSSSKCFEKCATFPVTIGADKNDEFHLTRSSSVSNPWKLVSAMKGGREKEGTPPKKLSVSWGADVYDPIPTSVSHYPKKKSQKRYKSNKKNGKSKQKGKNTRGSGSSKDRKHNNRNLPLGFLDFELGDEIGGHEPNCGSSFRGRACGGTVHVAYAEAT